MENKQKPKSKPPLIKYKNEFKKLLRETFEIGVEVLIEVLNTNAAAIKAYSKFIFGENSQKFYKAFHI